MQIKCVHGYFFFREDGPGEVSQFMSLFAGLEIVQVGDYFTFADLEDAPSHSIEGGEYLTAVATETCEGSPWDVMRENKLVYNFLTGLVVPIATITQRVELSPAGYTLLSPGLILPGSIMDDGSRVTDYAAWYLFGSGRFKYSGVSGE